jgi:hypothetical protein
MKGGYPGDPSKRTAQGKSSHVSFAGNQVTLHEIADRNDTAIRVFQEEIKGHHIMTKPKCTPGKPVKKKIKAPYKGRPTKEPRSNEPRIGCRESQDDVKDTIMQELWGKEDFQNTPNGLGEGSLL